MAGGDVASCFWPGDQMRITFVLPGYGWKPRGGYRVVYEYANRLVSRGHEVTVAHAASRPNHPGPTPYSFADRGRRFIRWMRDRWTHPRGISWHPVDPRVRLLYVPVLDTCYVPDADAVVATAWDTAEYVAGYPPAKGEKFYLIQHYETWDGPKDRVDATWSLPLHKIVIAKWLLKIAEEFNVEDVVHIPNGINLDIYRLTQPIEERPARICMLYSKMEWKGFRDGLQCLNLIKEKMPGISAILFGVDRGPSHAPSWIQYVKDPPQKVLIEDIYNHSSIYICPSWTEGWHLPAVEAMACGNAVVSTDNGGVQDYAIHAETALLSPSRRPDQLAENALALLSSDERRISLAKLGRERILEFTWEKSASRFEAFLREYVH